MTAALSRLDEAARARLQEEADRRLDRVPAAVLGSRGRDGRIAHALRQTALTELRLELGVLHEPTAAASDAPTQQAG